MRAKYTFNTIHAIRARDLSTFIKWFVLLLFPILLVPNVADTDNGRKKIFVLHSYHQGLVWTDDIMEGVYSIFKRDDSDIDIHIEYMDTKRHFDGFDGKHLSSLLEVYRNKYGTMKFDVIISSDDNALRFLLMHHKELFPGTPIIFCGINDYKDEMLTGHEDITGVLEFLDQHKSIDIALKLHPETEQVFIITDTSTTGNANRLLIQGLATEYRDRAEFIFLDKDNSGLTQQELLDRLVRLPEGSIVYYSDFLRNKEGYIDQETTVPMITSKSKRPVYTHYDEILGLGVVGGKLVYGHSHGRKAAEIARKILQGTPVSEIPVYKESINRYMFDYLQLKRFGIAVSELPENSVVMNEPVSLYKSHKKAVWTASGVIGALLVLIVFLNINIVRRKSAEKKLKDAQGELEQKVKTRTDELLKVNMMLQEEILERKKVEAEKTLLYDSVPGYITVVDTDYRILTYNKTVEEQFGKDLKDRLCYEVYQARDEICPECAVKKCIESNKTEYTFQPATSVGKPVEIYAYPIFNEEGKIMAVVEHGMDVSEKLEMIEALKESEQRLREIIEYSGAGYFFVDTEGCYQNVNRAWLKMHKYTSEAEIVGKHVSTTQVDTDLDEANEMFKDILNKGKAITGEFSRRNKYGSTGYHTFTVKPVKKDSKTIGLEGFLIDVTERKKAEEKLRETEAILQAAMDCSSAAIAIAEAPDGKLIYVNKAGLLLGGGTEEELANDVDINNYVSSWQILHFDGTPYKTDEVPLARAIMYGETCNAEFILRRPDGEDRIVWANAAPILDDKGNVKSGVVVFLDITERKQIEAELRQALDDKDLLMKEIHHRVKNNLAVIQSLLALQTREVADEDAKGKFLESKNRVQSMALIHERLYQSGDRASINFSDYMRNFVAQIVDSYKLGDARLKLDIDLPDVMFDVSVMIPLGLIVNELVSNALKYAFPEGKGGTLTVRLEQGDEGNTLVIKDDGPGLPEDFDIDRPGTLGMQIVTSLTTQIDGSLEIVQDGGTEFRISFREKSLR